MRTKLPPLTAAVCLTLTALSTGAVVSGPVHLASASSGPCGSLTKPPTAGYSHVIWIWMENHSYSDIIGQPAVAPYINSLATSCGVATNYHNISHPSLPNYVGTTSGLALSTLDAEMFASNGGVPTDCNPSPPSSCQQSEQSIFDQTTWKAYEDSMKKNCQVKDSGPYVVHHNPPPYFSRLNNFSSSSSCAANDVPYGQLASDLSSGTLPAFSFITPNDNHNTGGKISAGDDWLATNLPTILNSSYYTSDTTAVFVTWDEGEGADKAHGETCADTTHADTTLYPSCWVATIVVSPSTGTGSTSSTYFNHYSLLLTTEQLLGLPSLAPAGTGSMVSAFDL